MHPWLWILNLEKECHTWILESTEYAQATCSPGSALLLSLKPAPKQKSKLGHWSQNRLVPLQYTLGLLIGNATEACGASYSQILSGLNTLILLPTTPFLNPNPVRLPQLHVQNTLCVLRYEIRKIKSWTSEWNRAGACYLLAYISNFSSPFQGS